MMLANIGEELGLIGVAAVIGAVRAVRLRGLDIAVRCRDPFGKRLAAGLTVLVCGQAAVNIAGRHGHRPAHRDPAAVPLVRRLEPRRAARRGRDSP